MFRLLFQTIGPLDNAYSASALYPESLPEYKKFYAWIRHFEYLKVRGLVKIIPVNLTNHTLLVVHFEHRAGSTYSAKRMRKILGLTQNGQDIIFVESEFTEFPKLAGPFSKQLTPLPLDIGKIQGNVVYVKMRSILGVMNYLSHGVQIPQYDLIRGYAFQYRYPDGRPYDWSILLNGLINVCSSNAEPALAFVKTRVHGHWFYIHDADFHSKVTLDLLNLLLTLKAGDQLGGGVANPPILSLPVGGPS